MGRIFILITVIAGSILVPLGCLLLWVSVHADNVYCWCWDKAGGEESLVAWVRLSPISQDMIGVGLDDVIKANKSFLRVSCVDAETVGLVSNFIKSIRLKQYVMHMFRIPLNNRFHPQSAGETLEVTIGYDYEGAGGDVTIKMRSVKVSVIRIKGW